MSRPGFIEGVGVALVASVAGAASYTLLRTLFPGGSALQIVIAGLGLAYALYLLRRSGERTGRITVFVCWIAAAAGIDWLAPSLTLYVAGHLGLVWLVRSLYHHASLFTALADLGLVVLGVAAGVWAITQTMSLFAAIWCFFLVQACFVAIPPRIAGRTADGSARAEGDERFSRAHRAADAAVRKLSTVR
jgi:hypothetical protein